MLTGVALLAAVLLGAVVGVAAPATAEYAGEVTDPLILALVTLLLVGLRFGDFGSLRRAPRLVAVTLGINFLVVPLVAFALSSVIMIDAEALRIGVLLYCLFPCTDWFLGFTRLAGGDTVIGAALIPVNMAIQLALYPLYLHLLTGSGSEPVGLSDWATLVTWFAVPAAIALAVRAIVAVSGHAVSGEAGRRKASELVRRIADAATLVVLVALVMAIFVANVTTVTENPGPFARVLVTVFCFLLVIYLIGEFVAKRLALTHPERALLVMTTSARNAPLILSLTVVALPDQPLVHAAIVLGMLVEFPHLAVLQQLLVRARDRAAAVGANGPGTPTVEAQVGS